MCCAISNLVKTYSKYPKLQEVSEEIILIKSSNSTSFRKSCPKRKLAVTEFIKQFREELSLCADQQLMNEADAIAKAIQSFMSHICHLNDKEVSSKFN